MASLAAYEASFGVVGLGVMGSMLALNLAESGQERIAGFELDPSKAAAAEAKAGREGLGASFKAYTDLAAFVGALKRPRRLVMLVPAGKPVDSALAALEPLLAPGDMVCDGGNEWYENTERRAAAFEAKGLHYLGCGVSGGAEGARRGPSLMVGGPADAFALLEPTLSKIAARAPGDGKPCLGYFGKGGAGNYVKMVHNGIEYGDMQLIGEGFLLLSNTTTAAGQSRSPSDCADVFASWNEGPLQSFLVEITAGILAKRDADGAPLVDKVLDVCGSKGTGKWTVQEFAEHGVPGGTVAAALEARYLSAVPGQRAALAKADAGEAPDARVPLDAASLEGALLCAKICSYAQGLALIRTTSAEKGWAAALPEVLDCWRGGCIIRAGLLTVFRDACLADPALENLLLAPAVAALVAPRLAQWRAVVALAVTRGLPVPALSASLAYYDSLRRERLESAALIQAQRDCFGGHTYKRVDAPGAHTTGSGWLAP